ncbi:hypothetical protein Tco_1244361 [Tanacetum coccineum]
MESKDMVSSCLNNDVRELQQLREQEGQIKEKYNGALNFPKSNFQKIYNINLYHHNSFKFLFGQEFDTGDHDYELQIVLLEEELRIKERDVKERREHGKRVNEFEMLKQERMINEGTTSDTNLDSTLSRHQGECSSSGDDTDAKREKQAKESCLIHFRILHTLLEDISKEDFANTCFSSRFQRAFLSLFGEDVEYFSPRLFFNMDKLEKQLNEEEFNEEIAMVVFKNENSRLGNDTRAESADIRFSNDTEPMNEDAEQRLEKRLLLASVIENKTNESLNQTLESENDCLKKTIAQFQKDFSKLEAQKINLLRAQFENLKGKSVKTKFDKPLILEKPPADKLLINSQISKSWFASKIVVQKDLSKPVTA